MTDSDQRQFYQLLGARIRQLRQSKLSQEQLAKAASLSRTSIVNIECGRQKLLLHNLFEIAKALNVAPSELLAPMEPKNLQTIDLGSAGDKADWIHRSLSKAAHIRVPQ